MRYQRLQIGAQALLLFCASAWALPGETTGKLRVEPHHYLGQRGQEPTDQMAISGQLEWQSRRSRAPWLVRVHADFETWGRKDNSVDLDRAWWQWPLGTQRPPILILGRIHPGDVSQNPFATRPWSLYGSTQPQNRSILLGSPFADSVFPSPIVNGWVGAHFWSTEDLSDAFQWGLSVSPLFVPSLGSSMNPSAPAGTRVGRFGRRPPRSVYMEGQPYDIDYVVDYTDVARELLQPQIEGQTYHRLETNLHAFETWVALRRAPGDLKPETRARLDIRTEPRASVTVVPRFPEQWSASLTQRISRKNAPQAPSLLASAQVRDSGHWGGEVGLDMPLLGVSYLSEHRPAAVNADYTFDDAPYAHHLVQGELRVPVATAVVYGGTKYHLTQGDSWIRAGVRSKPAAGFGWDVGMDVFTGKNGSYFGEWRSNDRFYLGLVWGLGQ